MGEHRFGHVYLMFTVEFGRFQSVAEASGAKSESLARNGKLQIWFSAFGGLGSGTREPVPEQGLVFRYQPWGTGTRGGVPVPN